MQYPCGKYCPMSSVFDSVLSPMRYIRNNVFRIVLRAETILQKSRATHKSFQKIAKTQLQKVPCPGESM